MTVPSCYFRHVQDETKGHPQQVMLQERMPACALMRRPRAIEDST